MNLEPDLTPQDAQAVAAIKERIIGWSTESQYRFFKTALGVLPEIENILVLGVYYGRDIAFILDILARYHPSRQVNIVGVDRFSSEPCSDWNGLSRSWEEATHGMPAPDILKARGNIMQCPLGAGVKFGESVMLVASDHMEFLRDTQEKFELIYVDGAHDYVTVKEQLQLVPRVCRNEAAVIAGDDYCNLNGWGVESAVREAFASFRLIDQWIWYARLSEMKK